jgi:hypothetical protein
MGGKKRWEARPGDTQRQMGFYGFKSRRYAEPGGAQTRIASKAWRLAKPGGQQKHRKKVPPYYYFYYHQ